MKYGIVVSVSRTKFGPVVFKENLSENMTKAANLGYDGVEAPIIEIENQSEIPLEALWYHINLLACV